VTQWDISTVQFTALDKLKDRKIVICVRIIRENQFRAFQNNLPLGIHTTAEV